MCAQPPFLSVGTLQDGQFRQVRLMVSLLASTSTQTHCSWRQTQQNEWWHSGQMTCNNCSLFLTKKLNFYKIIAQSIFWKKYCSGEALAKIIPQSRFWPKLLSNQGFSKNRGSRYWQKKLLHAIFAKVTGFRYIKFLLILLDAAHSEVKLFSQKC